MVWDGLTYCKIISEKKIKVFFSRGDNSMKGRGTTTRPKNSYKNFSEPKRSSNAKEIHIGSSVSESVRRKIC